MLYVSWSSLCSTPDVVSHVVSLWDPCPKGQPKEVDKSTHDWGPSSTESGPWIKTVINGICHFLNGFERLSVPLLGRKEYPKNSLTELYSSRSGIGSYAPCHSWGLQDPLFGSRGEGRRDRVVEGGVSDLAVVEVRRPSSYTFTSPSETTELCRWVCPIRFLLHLWRVLRLDEKVGTSRTHPFSPTPSPLMSILGRHWRTSSLSL